jgi:hypothetical protein
VKEEHFSTLFDSNYLPLGLALHDSLMAHAQPFHLWVICMDEAVERQLKKLGRPHLTAIPLREVETPALLGVKGQRTRAEYCWTLTPFTSDAILSRCPEAQRVTYLDADLFFFDDPRILLAELDEPDAKGKTVLITEHAYAPEYNLSATAGRFCVQFITSGRDEGSRRVMRWWQDRCIECCSETPVNGKFGDQVYLDQWPDLFGDTVHILKQTDKTLAPWNVRHMARLAGGDPKPVFYHFASLRIVEPRWVRLNHPSFVIGAVGRRIYRQYVQALSACLKQMHAADIATPTLPMPPQPLAGLRRAVRRALLLRTDRFMRLEL